MITQRDVVPEGSAISRALDYSLKRRAALSRCLDDAAVPINNNWAENQIRQWALRAQELALRWVATPRKAGWGDYELDPVCAAEWS